MCVSEVVAAFLSLLLTTKTAHNTGAVNDCQTIGGGQMQLFARDQGGL